MTQTNSEKSVLLETQQQIKNLLNILQPAKYECLACELLTCEFSYHTALATPHLIKTWQYLDKLNNGLKATENLPEKIKPLQEKLTAYSQEFSELESEYKKINDDSLYQLPDELSEKINSSLLSVSHLINEIEYELKKATGWTPWYFSKYSFLLIFLIALIPVYIYANKKMDENRLGFSIVSSRQGWGILRIHKSVDNNPLRVSGQECSSGLGTHADSEIIIRPKKGASRLKGICGLDDEKSAIFGSIECKIMQNDDLLFSSALLKGENRSESFDIGIDSEEDIKLIVNNGNDGKTSDHADWCDLIAE